MASAISMKKMTVVVNGLGNIGTTLVNVLLRYQQLLNIERVIAYKNCPEGWHEDALQILADQGADVMVAEPLADFTQSRYADVLAEADYVFETREHGFGQAEKLHYAHLIADENQPLLAACSQGSEKQFGVPYMAGLDPSAISSEPFVTVVSCNTHGLAAILRALCGEQLASLEHADAVVVRRSEDLGSNGRLVGANVIARHLDDRLGTHHAIDATDLFNSLGIAATITSSDITTPSQVMHALRFNLTYKSGESPQSISDIIARLEQQPYIATTHLFDSGQVHSLGRRYGFQGRIYAHAVVVANQFLLTHNTLKGWAFVPQEACTIFSSLAAYWHQTEQEGVDVLSSIGSDLIRQSF